MDVEVASLKANVDNLSHCLHALLKRIEQLEGTAKSNTGHYYFTDNIPKKIGEAVNGLTSVNDIKEKNNQDPDVKVSFFICFSFP